VAARGGSSLANLSPIAKVGIGAGLVVLVGVAYFVVFYGDLSSSIKAAQQRERQLHTEIGEARQAEHSYQKDLNELTDRRQRERELNKILPATTEYPSFLSSLQGVANVSGISLSAWTPQEEVPEQFYARVPMKLELAGRYHQIAKFFYGVGQLDRIINMENIAILDPQKVGDDIVVKVEALATAFHTNAAQPAVAPGGADATGAEGGAAPPAATGGQ
jgi:type IV pilus assembly protein PilO